jgi:hypothetical protein
MHKEAFQTFARNSFGSAAGVKVTRKKKSGM